MSLDLAWDELNDALAQRLIDILNKQLATVSRPSFIGPVEITGLDFGTVCPDVEVVDMRDIYRDFLEDDEDDDATGGANRRKGEGKEGGTSKGEIELEEDEYEWIPRRNAELAAAYDSPTYHQLPPYVRYDRMAASVPNLADLRPGLGFRPFQQGFHESGLGMAASMYNPHTPSLNALGPETSFGDRASPVPIGSASLAGAPSMQATASSLSTSNSVPTPVLDPNASAHPNIQLHLRVLHHSDLRLSLTTSLLINYPSPMFLALPIKLAVTGLEFTGEVVVAYEGASSPRRVHFCLLDDLDPYGLAASVKSDVSRDGAEPAAKPLPVGQRLLPSIFIESEIGQADKHVLKNVTRVERFIQDVIRKTVEDELVFPNFHTIVLGE